MNVRFSCELTKRSSATRMRKIDAKKFSHCCWAAEEGGLLGTRRALHKDYVKRLHFSLTHSICVSLWHTWLPRKCHICLPHSLRSRHWQNILSPFNSFFTSAIFPPSQGFPNCGVPATLGTPEDFLWYAEMSMSWKKEKTHTPR